MGINIVSHGKMFLLPSVTGRFSASDSKLKLMILFEVILITQENYLNIHMVGVSLKDLTPMLPLMFQ